MHRRRALTVDGVAAPEGSLRWTMNNRTFSFEELVDETGEWWFPLDSAVLSGEIPSRTTGPSTRSGWT